MSNNIVCRKCGGNHFTTKCGRDNSTVEAIAPSDRQTFNKDKFNNNKKKENIFRVQISNLPLDMSDNEMKELLYNWGEITKIKVINYEESSVAYIDFKYKEQSEHFINALDKTFFDNNTIYTNAVKSY
jgi:hypothetical protein